MAPFFRFRLRKPHVVGGATIIDTLLIDTVNISKTRAGSGGRLMDILYEVYSPVTEPTTA